MSTDSISDFLAEQRDVAPEELQPLILNFEDYWERKLWHQLTDALVEFFNDDGSAPQRLAFYNVFILKFADKINKLKLVMLALKAATQCKGLSLAPTKFRTAIRLLTISKMIMTDWLFYSQ